MKSAAHLIKLNLYLCHVASSYFTLLWIYIPVYVFMDCVYTAVCVRECLAVCEDGNGCVCASGGHKSRIRNTYAQISISLLWNITLVFSLLPLCFYSFIFVQQGQGEWILNYNCLQKKSFHQSCSLQQHWSPSKNSGQYQFKGQCVSAYFRVKMRGCYAKAYQLPGLKLCKYWCQ